MKACSGLATSHHVVSSYAKVKYNKNERMWAKVVLSLAIPSVLCS